MWTGSGDRKRVRHITFDSPFRAAPVVQASFSLVDADTGPFLRAECRAENITATGFDLVVITWADSRLARIRLAWIAIGEAPYEDDWDV